MHRKSLASVPAVPALGLALVALLGPLACAKGDDETRLDGRPVGDRPAETTEPPDGGPDETEPPDDGAVTPTPTRDVVEGTIDDIPLRLEVQSLTRQGGRLELRMVLANQATAPTDVDAKVFRPSIRFGVYDVRQIRLVTPTSTEGYYPLVDTQGQCLCSGGFDSLAIEPGATLDLYATFEGLPDDVEQVDLYVPGFPPATGIPLEG